MVHTYLFFPYGIDTTEGTTFEQTNIFKNFKLIFKIVRL